MGRPSSLGIDLDRLVSDIYDACGRYQRLIVRGLYYILVSQYGYPGVLNFYKNYVDRYLTKLRRADPALDAKFTDPSRELIVPPMAWRRTEVWVEKRSIYDLLSELFQRFRVPAQVLRGFGSLSMFRDAVKRARERGVKRILYLGDWGPSALCIEEVAKREVEVEIIRVALTYRQAKKLPSVRVKRTDTRSRKYLSLYGDRCWEIEALPPDRLSEIVEEALRREIPADFLREAELKEEASKLVKEILEPLVQRLEAQAYELMRAGLSRDEIRRKLAEEFELS